MEEDDDFINLDDSVDDLIELAPAPKRLRQKDSKSPRPKASSAKKTSPKRLKRTVELELTDSDGEPIAIKPQKPKRTRAPNKPKLSASVSDDKPVVPDVGSHEDMDLDDIQWEDVGGDEIPETMAEMELQKKSSLDAGIADEHELDIKMDVDQDKKGNEKAKNEKKRKRESTGPKKRRGSKTERSYALDWHNMQLLAWLGHAIFSKRQSERNQLHQAIMVSYLPFELFEEMLRSVQRQDPSSAIGRLLVWFHQFFKIVEPLKAPTRIVPTTQSNPIDLTETTENVPPSLPSKSVKKSNSNLSSSNTTHVGDEIHVHRRFCPFSFSNTPRPVVSQQVAFQAFSVILDALDIPHRTIWWLDQLLVPSKFADFSLVMPKVSYSPYRFTRALLLALHTVYKSKVPLKSPLEDEIRKESILPQNCQLLWFEVFSNAQNRWIPVDLFRKIIDNAQSYNQATLKATKLDSPERKKRSKLSDCDCGYIFAVGRNGKLAHVSSRYSLTYSDPLFKMGDWVWVMEMIKKWNVRLLEDDGLRSEKVDLVAAKRMDEADAAEIELVAQGEGFPKSLTDYKNHPLYVLERDLLKFEVLRPDHAESVHKVGEHDVYLRRDVSQIHTADKWIQEGLQVKEGETAVMEYFKFTVANWDMAKKKWLDEDEAEKSPYFGDWQIEPFQAPTAVNGIVPKNKYGNVYMFKENMLPIGCVHLKGEYPQMDRSARKIGIDIAPAMVGWAVEQYWSIPVLDGWIICNEHVQTVIDAWVADSAVRIEQQKRKIRDKATQHWLSLTKQLLLKAKFDLKQEQQRIQTQMEQENTKTPNATIIPSSASPASSETATLNSTNTMQGIETSSSNQNMTRTSENNFASLSAKANAQHTHTFPAHLNITDSLGNVTRRCICGYSDSTQRL